MTVRRGYQRFSDRASTDGCRAGIELHLGALTALRHRILRRDARAQAERTIWRGSCALRSLRAQAPRLADMSARRGAETTRELSAPQDGHTCAPRPRGDAAHFRDSAVLRTLVIVERHGRTPSNTEKGAGPWAGLRVVEKPARSGGQCEIPSAEIDGFGSLRIDGYIEIEDPGRQPQGRTGIGNVDNAADVPFDRRGAENGVGPAPV